MIGLHWSSEPSYSSPGIESPCLSKRGDVRSIDLLQRRVAHAFWAARDDGPLPRFASRVGPAALMSKPESSVVRKSSHSNALYPVSPERGPERSK